MTLKSLIMPAALFLVFFFIFFILEGNFLAGVVTGGIMFLGGLFLFDDGEAQ